MIIRDINLLRLSNVSHYLYYRFNPANATDLSTQASLGADTALLELHSKGYRLATKEWVDNHWSLILWKMIGMACLEPEKHRKKWCWEELMRQLQYRYNREIGGASRPALRLITTRDAPAAVPMILCISDIFWAEEYVDKDNKLVPAHPTLEVTDGWYRLRAEVDEALARAVRNQIIKTGRKIAVCGAKLESIKKDGVEILEAYGDSHLVLSGNSTHMAPWHAKLGFQRSPSIVTLGSLSPDGGGVPIVDFIVTQIYPVGYIEFVMTESGDMQREGPRTEKDEAIEEDLWQRRRDKLAAKLHDELEKKWQKLESYADRLYNLAGSGFAPSEEDQPPDGLEDLVDELEEDEQAAPEVLKSVRGANAGWLAILIRKKCETGRVHVHEEMERELAVRNFRILRIKDARTIRKPAIRTAQLTVWDVMSLQMTEGAAAGSFTVGQRYMVCYPRSFE
ncbi:hypothetical protein M422DRAFT_154724 [Sphaerobolus stellatus SS14]|nr:hypothetical protein M422DRAFT_154724 [Sphaerobolus stellatus SS14]